MRSYSWLAIDLSVLWLINKFLIFTKDFVFVISYKMALNKHIVIVVVVVVVVAAAVAVVGSLGLFYLHEV